ncbi:hypothetical protein SI65_01154 [Aspergillus cristatus]|uniref:25S rRNA (uridine-N(3))-methyltransferase BMT5-like domain-containing protein n=1 Tax=Aspergillus cristatus TaxID=573508 RepID=A0A1E3BRI3_ASPCR|nr:hypothetical protein SI65_01154 [Aspergillus cristatus]
MPKAKKARIAAAQGGGGDAKRKANDNNKKSKMNTFPRLSTNANNNNNTKKNNNNNGKLQKNQRPIVPFGRNDRVLLIGEGDFSFARSLVVQHRCRNVLATCYDSKNELRGKYPQVEETIQEIQNAFLKKDKKRKTDSDENGEHDGQPGTSDEKDDANDEQDDKQKDTEKPQTRNKNNPKVLFSIDARKLGHASAGGGKDVRIGFPRPQPRKRPAWLEARRAAHNAKKKNDTESKGEGGPWDIICFNFPHVGGLSTDVNRQVRFNQELLVAFFKTCVPLLSRPVDDHDADDDDEFEDEENWGESSDSPDGSDGDGSGKEKSKPRAEPGKILVTLFEGEPYTLWNIKDLARHAGLKVVTSFRFPWDSYQGYSHARTLGHIEGKQGGRGGWKGEDRDARMYVFELKDDHATSQSKTNAGAKKKRSRNESDSDDSD